MSVSISQIMDENFTLVYGWEAVRTSNSACRNLTLFIPVLSLISALSLWASLCLCLTCTAGSVAMRVIATICGLLHILFLTLGLGFILFLITNMVILGKKLCSCTASSKSPIEIEQPGSGS